MSMLRYDSSHRTAPMSGPPTEVPGIGSGLSVIVPAKNEAASLPQLVGEIASALRPLVADGRLTGFEIVVVDDGSTDTTPETLDSLAPEFPELRPIRLAQNVGQSAAPAAGFRAARGAWVATLDADLQNDPADLPRLWEAMGAGLSYDAALGWRARRNDVWSRRAISKAANAIRNAVLGQAIKDTGCSMRIFPRDKALRLPLFQGSHRFLGPLLIREGCRIVQLPVNHRARPHGKSHYNIFNRSIKVVIDLLGVAWLLRRPIRYEVAAAEVAEPTPVAAPRAAMVQVKEA